MHPYLDYKSPAGSPAMPYPFDGLRLDGERADGAAITIESIKLLPAAIRLD